MIEAHQAVKGLVGGKKQMWLRNHRPEVMAYYNKHGADATRQRFLMQEVTLNNFLFGNPVKFEKLSKADRALYLSMQALEHSRENKGRVIDMEQKFVTVAPLFEAGRSFIKAVQKLEPLQNIGDVSNPQLSIQDVPKGYRLTKGSRRPRLTPPKPKLKR